MYVRTYVLSKLDCMHIRRYRRKYTSWYINVMVHTNTSWYVHTSTSWYVHTNTSWYVHTHRGTYKHIMVHTNTSWYIQTHHGTYKHIVVHTHRGNIGSDTDSPDYRKGRKVVTVQPDRYLFFHVPHEHKCMYVCTSANTYVCIYIYFTQILAHVYCAQTVLTVGNADKISIK